MRSILIFALLTLASAFCVAAQVPKQGAETPAGTTATAPDGIATAPTKSGTVSNNDPKAAVKQQNDYVRPDSKTRFNRYVKRMVGPMAIGRNVFSAGFSTWKNSPEEWGDNWEGFGRRVASSFGKGAIKNTTAYALEEAFKLDSSYYKSKDKSVGAKFRNAVLSPVTARNKNGKRVFGFPRVIGAYTAGIASAELWYPSRYNYKDGLRGATISLGMNAGYNLFKEFIWKK